ncbi:MAG: hypothetical protein HY322_00375 [Betaproteobacteria bacterium]|nr:hypothetical protein [Betaproteobacteria bacterium]
MTRLVPRKGGRYLSLMEVITRVRAAFAYVEASGEGARDYVLACVDRLAFPADDGRTAVDGQAAEDGRVAAAGSYAVQLERFQNAARLVHFGDDLGADGVLISLLMIPRQPLIIEAHGEDEETRVLIYRCAAALDYEVVSDDAAVGDARPDAAYAGSYAAAA